MAEFSSDDISSLLNTLLHNSSQPSTTSNTHHQQPPPETPHPGAGISSDSVGLFDSGFGFSGAYHSSGTAAAVGSMGMSMDEINNEADCESEENEDTRVGTAAGVGRSSSKRSRAAEFHNLSEKRRRQRINEKMKALQKLIPNSNKTDKASMLDEAIEYLKQLQLQVQMLTMRNGSNLHPYNLRGIAEPLQQPQVAPLLDEGNNGRGIVSFNAEQEPSMQVMLDLWSKPEPSSDYKQFMPGMTVNNSSGPPLLLKQYMSDRHYCASSSKVLCKDPALPPLQLDMSHCGQSSSSGMSS